MHCHLVGHSLKIILSIQYYLILFIKEGTFCVEFVGAIFHAMDNSMCHNGRKITDELENLKLDRVDHPPYSRDLIPCDFWLFGMLKQKVQDRVFDTIEEILMAIRKIWSEMTFEDFQSVFFDWIQQVEYVIEHEWEYYVN
jgi:hypothetical protein